MKKILLSGASGFVGSNLSKYLVELNYSIKTINLKNRFDNRILEDHDVFIHLAGKAHDVKDVSDPAEYYLINTDLTKSFFDAFFMAGLPEELSKWIIFYWLISKAKDFDQYYDGILYAICSPHGILFISF